MKTLDGLGLLVLLVLPGILPCLLIRTLDHFAYNPKWVIVTFTGVIGSNILQARAPHQNNDFLTLRIFPIIFY